MDLLNGGILVFLVAFVVAIILLGGFVANALSEERGRCPAQSHAESSDRGDRDHRHHEYQHRVMRDIGTRRQSNLSEFGASLSQPLAQREPRRRGRRSRIIGWRSITAHRWGRWQRRPGRAPLHRGQGVHNLRVELRSSPECSSPDVAIAAGPTFLMAERGTRRRVPTSDGRTRLAPR